MFELVSQVLKYVFIIIIYLFIFSILRLMYLDIRGMADFGNSLDNSYLKVVNRLDSLNFKMAEHYVLKPSMTLGRSSKNDIIIKDKFVSKKHLEIFGKDSFFYLKDLNSANGTYLNGEKVEPQVPILLQNGDRIGVGFIQFIFVENR